nr:hypothetical protein [Blastocatellia bacterium]
MMPEEASSSPVPDPEKRVKASENENHALKEQIHALDELLWRARQKLRSAKRKQADAEYYRSILHDLRSRWYLRPFLPSHKLQPPKRDFADCWIYRGPRFDQASSGRRRVLVVGHLLSSALFGSERSLLEIIAAMDLDKFDVFAVFPERNEKVFAALRSQVQGIALFDYFWWRKDRPFDEETVTIFEQICRQRAIDLVHVNTIMLIEPQVAARRVGIPAITNARELISQDADLTARLGGDAPEI